MCTRRRPPAWRRATTPDEARLRAASALRGPADRPRLPILEPIRRHFGVANRVHDIFMAHIVLEGSGVVPIVGELVTSGVPEHVRVNREWELGGFSCPSDHFQKSCRGRWRRRSSLAAAAGRHTRETQAADQRARAVGSAEAAMTPNIVWATEERALNSWVSWGSCVTEHKFKIGRLVQFYPQGAADHKTVRSELLLRQVRL